MSLIDSSALRRLWDDAQKHPEWATTRLWEHLFRHRFFSNERWIIASQQPPTHKPGDLRRIDLIVEDGNQADQFTLLFMEAKRANATADEIMQVEFQAYTAACAYAIDTNRHEPLWTMTCVGSRARLWVFTFDVEFLIPFVPESHAHAEKAEYIEISGPQGQEIKKALDYIKKHPRPPSQVLQKTPSPRPENATLPDGWHADEVEYLDAQRKQGGGQSSATMSEPGASGSGGAWPAGERTYSYTEEPSGSEVPVADEMVVDKSWIGVVVIGIKTKSGQKRYECQSPDDGHACSLGDDWVLQDFQLGEHACRGYVQKGQSGNTYYTFSLEPPASASQSSRKRK